MNAPFRWLVSVSAICQLVGFALLLWGLRVVPVSNPFISSVRDSAPRGEKVPGPAEREHPWAVMSGAVLFIVGLTLVVVAGAVKP